MCIGVTDYKSRKDLTKLSWQLLQLYSPYLKGFLYSAGGVNTQPAIYLEAMNIIENEVQKWLKTQSK